MLNTSLSLGHYLPTLGHTLPSRGPVCLLLRVQGLAQAVGMSERPLTPVCVGGLWTGDWRSRRTGHWRACRWGSGGHSAVMGADAAEPRPRRDGGQCRLRRGSREGPPSVGSWMPARSWAGKDVLEGEAPWTEWEGKQGSQLPPVCRRLGRSWPWAGAGGGFIFSGSGTTRRLEGGAALPGESEVPPALRASSGLHVPLSLRCSGERRIQGLWGVLPSGL